MLVKGTPELNGFNLKTNDYTAYMDYMELAVRCAQKGR